MNSKQHRSLFQVALASLASIAALTAYSSAAQAQSATTVSFAGPGSVTLTGVLYTPAGYASGSNYSAVVMMHGCSGMWSNKVVGASNGNGTPNLQNNVEKWGWQLAAEGIVALAVDSFSPRKPANVDSALWQDQCSGKTYASQVNPYTTRALDAQAAWDYLAADSRIDDTHIGLLGWSHGAQAAMTEAAITSRDSDTERPEADMLFAATVLFYPGCGGDLEFGGVGGSYWRPYNDVRLNVGKLDGFHDNCQARSTTANTYGAPAGAVTFADYDGAYHSFDSFSQTWPTSFCAGPSPSGDECAMRDADIESLDFLLDRI